MKTLLTLAILGLFAVIGYIGYQSWNSQENKKLYYGVAEITNPNVIEILPGTYVEKVHPWDDKTWRETYKKTGDRQKRFGISSKPVSFKQHQTNWSGGSSLSKEEIEKIVRKTFKKLPHVKTTKDTIALMVETAITESWGGKDIWNKYQDAGMFQTKVSTAKDTIAWVKTAHPDIYKAIISLRNNKLSEKDNLIKNIPYNVAICITYYWRMGGAEFYKYITNKEDRAKFWKSVYNTHKGAGTVNDYLKRIEKYAVSDTMKRS